jgi:N-methylhydantoinase B
MDVTLLTPVFWDGRLFCWITNVFHQYDVGGITPGSFCPNARDAFDEGILIPPVKIVERGAPRRDIEAVYQWFEQRRMPGDISELRGDPVTLQLRQLDIVQNPADMYAVAFAAGASYGDPVERDPEAVRRDVELGDISAAAARALFSVVLVGQSDELRVDTAATAALRHQVIVARLGREPRAPRAPRLPVLRHITETLDLVITDGRQHFACCRCGHVLCAVSENYKAHALRLDRPIQAANPLIGDPQRFIDAAVQFRQFCCPACGVLIENEVCRAEDPLLWDIQLTGA